MGAACRTVSRFVQPRLARELQRLPSSITEEKLSSRLPAVLLQQDQPPEGYTSLRPTKTNDYPGGIFAFSPPDQGRVHSSRGSYPSRILLPFPRGGSILTVCRFPEYTKPHSMLKYTLQGRRRLSPSAGPGKVILGFPGFLALNRFSLLSFQTHHIPFSKSVLQETRGPACLAFARRRTRPLLREHAGSRLPSPARTRRFSARRFPSRSTLAPGSRLPSRSTLAPGSRLLVGAAPYRRHHHTAGQRSCI